MTAPHVQNVTHVRSDTRQIRRILVRSLRYPDGHHSQMRLFWLLCSETAGQTPQEYSTQRHNQSGERQELRFLPKRRKDCAKTGF